MAIPTKQDRTYFDCAAEWYDTFYETKPYSEEARFVWDRLREGGVPPSGRLLELACGTGRHALELARLGASITATDISSAMVEKARIAAQREGVDITVLQQDMGELKIDGEPFDAAICLFDSIGFAMTNDALQATMRGVHRHIVKGGLFLFEFWHAPAMLRQYEPVRVRSWHLGDMHLYRIAETSLDVVTQTATVTYTVLQIGKGKEAREFRETAQARFFSIPEMQLLLTVTGWRCEAYWSGFSLDQSVSEDSWHIVMLARSL